MMLFLKPALNFEELLKNLDLSVAICALNIKLQVTNEVLLSRACALIVHKNWNIKNGAKLMYKKCIMSRCIMHYR